MIQLGVSLSARYVFIILFTLSIAFICMQYMYTVYESDLVRNSLSISDEESPWQFPSETPCTLDIFRQYYSKYHHFPTEGHWEDVGESTRYVSDVCRLTQHDSKTEFWSKCFQKSGIRSITVMGDSNTKLYHKAILAILKNVTKFNNPNDTFAKIKEELMPHGLIPEKEYFFGDDQMLNDLIISTSRECKFCHGIVSEFTYNWKNQDRVSIRLETIPVTNLMDASLSVKSRMGYKATTYQEFILKYHLKENYPDIMIFFVPFAHVKQGNDTLDRNKIDIEFFYSMANHYVPNTTRLFYIGTPSEVEHAKNSYWKGRLFQGMTGTEKIDKLNRILYQTAEKDMLKVNGNIFGFFDMVAMSASREAWTAGGVHYIQNWYDHVIQYLMEVICNSLVKDEDL